MYWKSKLRWLMSVPIMRAIGAGHGISSQAGATTDAMPLPLPAYYFAEFDLQDAEAIKPYVEGAAQTALAYGGVYLARGGQTLALEGVPPKRIVLIKFKSMAAAQDWYHSPEYTALRPYRQRSGITRNFVVEGFPD
ncbi:DUF1330 domain-containing protein [Duganella radicis]|uniref:DUF1330 domain-containing protein n=1 Tax=Duganella radicis TaxID=551988 RepID=A0A6L6PF50_9BURK|nr:DUF1330 domain-containing protein [Duganella radicis]MTV37207.1 DUF1330 domain-containing protein [Duganella radicis]